MPIHFRSTGCHEGYTPIASPANSPLQKISFGRLQLPVGSAFSARTEQAEVVLDIMAGRADVAVALGGEEQTWAGLGGRADVFGGDATYVCLPPGCSYTVTSRSALLDVAVAAGPCPPGGQPSVLRPGENEVRHIGALNWQRTVRLGTADSGRCRRLMVGETIGRPGAWSSYPPHKHDEEKPGEIPMEEVYFFRARPGQGFGIQVLYDAPGCAESSMTRSSCATVHDAPGRHEQRHDEAFLVRDGDTVVLDHGYHPVAAAPGYQLYYLWVLYSEAGVYGSEAWSDDPDHTWLHAVPPML